MLALDAKPRKVAGDRTLGSMIALDMLPENRIVSSNAFSVVTIAIIRLISLGNYLFSYQFERTALQMHQLCQSSFVFTHNFVTLRNPLPVFIDLRKMHLYERHIFHRWLSSMILIINMEQEGLRHGAHT